ncbi:MAG: RHS repeat-associated core domain-containing protein [Verrucomicrobia bacterium]|nr:RHS repeat-associated core domain-containing protein [Verrucomicrobiota bacterium]
MGYTYGDDGYMATKTDSLGRTTSYTWTPSGRPLTTTYADGATESWSYNELGSLLSYTDPLGRVTMYTRDSSNRVVRIDRPDGSFETFAYNQFGQIVSRQQRNGGIETSAYDARGLLTSKTDAMGNVTGYGYDANDRLARVTDARGNSTFMEYNERGLVTKTTYADASFKTWTYNEYGDVVAEANELGNTWNYTRDVFCRVTSVTDPLGRTATTEYLADSYEDKPLVKTLPSGRKAAFTYDKAWNTLNITNGVGTAEAAVTKFTYNKADKVIKITDPRNKVTTFDYDVRDRRISATDPLGNITLWSYDAVGNVLSVTRPDGGVTTNVYDEMNFLIWTRDPKMQVTEFTYDVADNLVALKDARGNSYQFTYDFLNRRTSMIYPDTSHEDYSYDAVGNLYTYRNRDGSIRTFTYDNRNRETLADWSDSTPDVSKTYDAAGRLLTLNNGVSALTYTYDAANQLLSESSVVSGQSSVVGYTYDADGNRASMTYPDGTVVTYDYTARSQLASVSSESSVIASYEYDLNGNRTGKTLGNGLFAKYTYNAASWLTALAHTNMAQAKALTRFNYTLDSVGNRTNKTQTTPKPTSGNWVRKEPYGYDAVDQITSVLYITNNVTTRTVSYQYDPVGNRQQVTDNGEVTGYTVNALNQYTVVDGATLGYDANGNLASAVGPPPLGNATAQYDAQNRLVSASGGPSSVTASFAYDARNRCVARTINGITTYLVYDGWSLIEERDATGAQLAEYIHGATIDEILCRTTSGATHYFHHDGLGSTIALTDSTGALLESYTYDVFGMPSFWDAAGNSLPSSLFANRFLFTGREYLADLTLYDYRNRFYSPLLGRFLQTDPVRFDAEDVNLYRYVSNNPARWLDSIGLMSPPRARPDYYRWQPTYGGPISNMPIVSVPSANNWVDIGTISGTITNLPPSSDLTSMSLRTNAPPDQPGLSNTGGITSSACSRR